MEGRPIQEKNELEIVTKETPSGDVSICPERGGITTSIKFKRGNKYTKFYI